MKLNPWQEAQMKASIERTKAQMRERERVWAAEAEEWTAGGFVGPNPRASPASERCPDGEEEGLDDQPVKPQIAPERARTLASADDDDADRPDDARPSALVLAPGSPSLSADEFLARRPTRLIYWRKDFYAWDQTHYQMLDDDDVRAAIYAFLDGAWTDKGDLFRSNRNRVADVIDALKSKTLIPQRRDALTWTDGRHEPDLISCRNGLLRLSSGVLEPHNPDLLVLNTLPFAAG